MDTHAGIPSVEGAADRSVSAPLLRLDRLTIEYRSRRKTVFRAVSGVSLLIRPGETLGLVGESGCGKTSLARAVANLLKPSAGRVIIDGMSLTGGACNGRRPNVQMIFQNAAAALNPCRGIGKSIAEPLRAAGTCGRRARFEQAARIMAEVDLDPRTFFHRRPFELSGGQCQRAGIARALIASPRLLVCDEPVSSLDVSIQAQILNLLRTMRTRYELTMLFISHDLAVIRNISHRVAVMLAGTLCEASPSAPFYRWPLHPYSRALLAAVPGRGGKSLPATPLDTPHPPTAAALSPSGCPYSPRCPYVRRRCRERKPRLRPVSRQRQVACHFPLV
jgi:peptide/nickel transport system ATP-binding protein